MLMTDQIDKIIAYETDGLNTEDTIKLFSELIKDGTVWQLQGHYGRTAKNLIDIGVLDTKGKQLKTIEELEAEYQ